MSWNSVLQDLLSDSDDSLKVQDEEIVNVLRRRWNDIVVGTTEIAEAVGMSNNGIIDRLEELEEDGRVRSRKIGERYFWALNSGERLREIPPKINRVVHALDKASDLFKLTRKAGVYFILFGFTLIFLALSDFILGKSIPLDIPVSLTIAAGYSIAAGGGVAWVFAGSVQLFAIAAEYALCYSMTGELPDSWRRRQ